MHRSLPLAAAFVAGVTIFATVPLAGCGGGNGSIVQPTEQPDYAARSYTGYVALENGQFGTYVFSTAADGTASGTFTVDDGKLATPALQSRLVIATPLLSGTFNPTTGAFNLSGAYIFNGQSFPITLQGTLPIPPSTTGGQITVTTGGQTYNSSFGSTGPATPAPTPTPSVLPSVVPSPGATILQFTVVSKSADCNFSDAGFANLKIQNAKYTVGGLQGQYLFYSSYTSQTNGNYSISIGWQRLNGMGLIPETFTFVPNPAIGAFGDDFQGILQTTIAAPTGQIAPGFWNPTGGKLIVESVVGRTVRVRGENVEFSPNRFNAASAKGTFTANFDATFQNVQGL